MIGTLPAVVPALAPVDQALATVRRRVGPHGTRGLASGLIVPEEAPGWAPASALFTPPELAGPDGGQFDKLLTVAARRWEAPPHVAASLAWHSYTYWLTMPVVLTYAITRRVLRVDPDDVLVLIEGDPQLLRIGLRRARWVVLPDDPLAAHADDRPDRPDRALVQLVDGEERLLAAMRHSLRAAHLDPLQALVQRRVRLSARLLHGSTAAAVAYAVVRGVSAPAADLQALTDTLLSALHLPDLVELVPGPDGLAVQRRTCCLAFTLPRPKVCRGCCLQDRID